jgi:hypothetical protein
MKHVTFRLLKVNEVVYGLCVWSDG